MSDLFKKYPYYKEAVATGLDATSTATTFCGDFSAYESVSVQVVYRDMDVGDGTIQMQQRFSDATPYSDITGLSATLSTTSATDDEETLQDDHFGSAEIGLKYTAGTDTAGTYDVYVMAKEKKEG